MITEWNALKVFGAMEEIFNNTTEIKDKLKKLDEANEKPKVYVATDNNKDRKCIMSLVLSSIMVNGKEVFVISKSP